MTAFKNTVRSSEEVCVLACMNEASTYCDTYLCFYGKELLCRCHFLLRMCFDNDESVRFIAVSF
jgi:hypothetical protein